ncbi:MAG: 4Fe-4S binding protein, partial [Kiritimatiellota bacterium]|nr:4Fe-4S binding protein [Kiritimatiellota bacterium]
SQIELVGNVPLPLQRPPFRVPVPASLLNQIPIWLVRLLAPYVWIRPSFTARCVKCGLCVKACPVTALRMAEETGPVLAPSACIGCCCCHEVCAQRAVVMTQSFLLNLRKRWKLPS